MSNIWEIILGDFPSEFPDPSLPFESVGRVPREVIDLRRDNLRVLRSEGEKVALVQAYTIVDFERGLVSRCTSCYSEYRGQAEMDCPECLGTTYSGGYRQALYAYMILEESTDTFDTKKRGIESIQSPRGHAVWSPLIHEGDLVARLDIVNGIVTQVRELFRVEANEWETLRIQGTNVENCIIGQSLTLSRVPDDSSLRGLTFLTL